MLYLNWGGAFYQVQGSCAFSAGKLRHRPRSERRACFGAVVVVQRKGSSTRAVDCDGGLSLRQRSTQEHHSTTKSQRKKNRRFSFCNFSSPFLLIRKRSTEEKIEAKTNGQHVHLANLAQRGGSFSDAELPAWTRDTGITDLTRAGSRELRTL